MLLTMTSREFNSRIYCWARSDLCTQFWHKIANCDENITWQYQFSSELAIIYLLILICEAVFPFSWLYLSVSHCDCTVYSVQRQLMTLLHYEPHCVSFIMIMGNIIMIYRSNSLMILCYQFCWYHLVPNAYHVPSSAWIVWGHCVMETGVFLTVIPLFWVLFPSWWLLFHPRNYILHCVPFCSKYSCLLQVCIQCMAGLSLCMSSPWRGLFISSDKNPQDVVNAMLMLSKKRLLFCSVYAWYLCIFFLLYHSLSFSFMSSVLRFPFSLLFLMLVFSSEPWQWPWPHYRSRQWPWPHYWPRLWPWHHCWYLHCTR